METHFCILKLCFVGERGDQGNVSALINGILIRNDAVNVFLVDRFQTRSFLWQCFQQKGQKILVFDIGILKRKDFTTGKDNFPVDGKFISKKAYKCLCNDNDEDGICAGGTSAFGRTHHLL